MTWVLIAYGAILLAIAALSLKYNDSFENFLVAGRKQPRFLIVASMLASTIGGGITIGTVNKAFSMGFAAFWFVAAGAIAHFLQGAFVSKKVRESEALTLPDLASKLAGPASRYLVSIIVVLTWTGIAAAQFLAASKVITTMTGLAPQWGVGIAALFLLVYTLIGGQKSVLRTDFFQFGVLAIALAVSLGWLFIARVPAPGSLKIELFSPKFGPLDFVYYLIVVGGSYFICPMMFGRILSSDSPANARKSSFMSGIGMTIFAFAITFVGLWAKAYGFDPGKLDPLNAIAKNVLPDALGVAMMVGILAAILSTGDTVLITAAGIVENDILGRKTIAGVRLWIVVIAVFGTLIALFEKDIVDLLLKTYNGYTAGIVPALFVAIVAMGKRKPHGGIFFAAILIGYVLGMAGSLAKDPNLSKWLPLGGLVASLLISLIALYVGPTKKESAL